MEFIPVPNTAQYDLIFTQAGQTIENVYHVLHNAPPGPADLLAMAAILKNWFSTSGKNSVVNEASLVKIVARSLESDSAPAVEFFTGLPIAGDITSSGPLPNNVTVAVRWLTALRGRSYRGRTYHIGLCQADVVESTILLDTAVHLESVYSTLMLDVNGAGGTLVVVSKFHAKAPRAVGVATEILGCSVDRTVDSQRRRLPGRGK